MILTYTVEESPNVPAKITFSNIVVKSAYVLILKFIHIIYLYY